MKIQKRTPQQQKTSVDIDKDFTGGYNYLNWIIFNRDGRGYTLSSIFILFWAIIAYCTVESILWTILPTLTSIFLNLWSYRSFRKLKKGISS